MKNNFGIKIIASILTIVLLSALGLFALISTAFMKDGRFYGILAITITSILAVIIILKIFQVLKKKAFFVVLAIVFLVCIVTVSVFEMNQSYHESIPTVDQDIDIYEYQPFAENTKVITIDEPATLKLSNDLPVIDGATALYPVYSAFAQAVYPEKEYHVYRSEVMCTKTGGAYRNLIDGSVDIIFAAQPSRAQISDARNMGLEFELTPIGYEAFVFFINTENPVKGLTKEEIQDIYSGKVSNWQELGGNNEEILAFQRPENSGSQTMLQKFMEGRELVTPPKEDVVGGMGGIIEQTADYKNYKHAIGYSFLFFATEMAANDQIRLLEVDGIVPSRETINNGEYPLTAQFYAVTTGSDNPNVDKFIDWILSDQGQKIIEKTGYTPLN